jgi:hydrogenase large subunit
MAFTITIDPISRIEGHLKIDVTVDTVDGKMQVVDARSSGTMFRGFEQMMIGRAPYDAVYYTQRICGVCPVSHSLAASMAVEKTVGVAPPTNGRVMRNLVLGANFIQSHILHFYHLAALDYLDTRGILDCAPWEPRFVTPDMIGGDMAAQLVGHYVQALVMRRKAHQMGAIFGGKLPCVSTFVPGGCTDIPTTEKVTQFRSLLTELRTFIDTVFIPDVQALGAAFADYFQIGAGCKNLIAYGVFETDSTGSSRLFNRGRYVNNSVQSIDPALIREYVNSSWFTEDSGNLDPSVGVTKPSPDKPGAYSWVKSPRYQETVYEAGPLARMWVNGNYRRGISAMDRIVARSLEAKKVADAMDGWLNELTIGQNGYTFIPVPVTMTGRGWVEAPRGALGHWVSIAGSKISRYQVITPTAWNASGRDHKNQPGPIEQALIGTPVGDPQQPVEVLRVIHSFDPCLACAVHVARPDSRLGVTIPIRGAAL